MDLGGDGTDGERLVEILAGAGRREAVFGDDSDMAAGSMEAVMADQGCELVDVLSKPMLREALRMEADTTVALMYGRQHRG